MERAPVARESSAAVIYQSAGAATDVRRTPCSGCGGDYRNAGYCFRGDRSVNKHKGFTQSRKEGRKDSKEETFFLPTLLSLAPLRETLS
jgi:hypothetical protein